MQAGWLFALLLATGSIQFSFAQNTSPVAHAGSDILCSERDPVMLDGSLSYDPDGDNLEYEWTQLQGPPVSIDPAAKQPSFEAPWFLEDSDLLFRLVVFDPQSASDTDSVVVGVQATPDLDDYLDLDFSDGSHSIPYRLFIPRHYDPAQKYPLLVYLHGAGARGINNTSQITQTGGKKFIQPFVQSAYPHFIIAPQCPSGSYWSNLCNFWPDPIVGDTTAPCGQWYNGASHWQVDTTIPMELIMLIKDSVIKHFSIDSSRLYAAGRSMGGFGTWDLITRQHDQFAAAIPVAGGGDPSRTPFITDMAVWAFHGDNDGTVDVRGSRNMIDGIFNGGGWPDYTEIPNGSHADACNGAWDEPGLYDWLFSHYKGDDSPPAAPAALTANPAGLTGFDLSWTAADDPQSGIHAYDIFRNDIRVASVNGLSFQDGNLDFETEYTYEIRAVNKSLTPGPFSAPVTRTSGSFDGSAFMQSSDHQGIVCFETEHYFEKGAAGGHAWEHDLTIGSSGGSAMRALPSNGTRINTDYASTSPSMNYTVDFVHTGTHYIWTRGLGDSDSDGDNDSYHAGLSGQETGSSDRITHFNSSWTWTRTTMDTPPASFNVPSQGIHTFNAWMREDGLIIDKIVITIDETYTPTGEGPPESERLITPPLPGAISILDCAPDADVYLYAASGWQGEYIHSGNGIISDLSPGNYLLSILQPGKCPAYYPAMVASESTTDISVAPCNAVPIMIDSCDTLRAEGTLIDTSLSLCAVMGDINHDYNLDLLCAFPDGAIRFYVHGGTGLQYTSTVSTGKTGLQCIRVADWNYDNIPDIVAGHDDGSIAVHAGRGDFTFDAASPLYNAGNGLTGFDIVDMDRDHDPDFILGYDNGALQQALYDGSDWILSPVARKSGGAITLTDSAAPCMTDLSGDGLSDIIAGTGGGDIFWFEADGGGAYLNRGVLNMYGDTAAFQGRSIVTTIYGASEEYKSLIISGSEGKVFRSALLMRADFVNTPEGIVNVVDLALFGDAFGKNETSATWESRFNLDLTEENTHQAVNGSDLNIFGDCWGNRKKSSTTY
ncbi:MAG: hypothetical protein GF401_17565 [Chitinivibrionales bacterium]|nr:hypothetical protein [Chitinivibrionales bacterium]